MRFSSVRSRRDQALTRRALKNVLLPLVLLCFAAGLPVLLIRGAGPDLYGLTPRVSSIDGYILVAWCGLERPHGAFQAGAPPAGARIRALGYMMDAGKPIRDGARVNRFVLLPDAGNVLHPAHRFGDQMIAVCLKTGSSALFQEGNLVWAWGAWKVLPGNSTEGRPLYQLQDAQVEKADKTEIPKYFR